MKTLDKKVRHLGSKPFAAMALLGLLSFGFDFALHSSHSDNGREISSAFFPQTAQAAEVEASPEESST